MVYQPTQLMALCRSKLCESFREKFNMRLCDETDSYRWNRVGGGREGGGEGVLYLYGMMSVRLCSCI